MIGRSAENTPKSRRFVAAALMIVVVGAALLIFLFADGSFLESDDLPKDSTADLASRSSHEPTNVTRRRDAADALESARRKESERNRRRLGGTVVDTDGRPADAVTIKLIDPGDATGTAADASLQFTPTPTRAEAVTDSAGRFELFAPSDGRFIIVARRGPAEFSDFRDVTIPTTAEIEIVLEEDDALPCIALDHDDHSIPGVEIAVVRSRLCGASENLMEFVDREIVRSDEGGIFLVPFVSTNGRGSRQPETAMIRHQISIGVRRNADSSTKTWHPPSARKDQFGRCVLTFEKTAPLTIELEFDGSAPPENFSFSLVCPSKGVRRTLLSSHGQDVVWTDCPATTIASVIVDTSPWQIKIPAPSESVDAGTNYARWLQELSVANMIEIPRLEASSRVVRLTFDQGRTVRVRMIDHSTRQFAAEIPVSIFGSGRSNAATKLSSKSGNDGVAPFYHVALEDHFLAIETLDWAILNGPPSGLRSWIATTGEFIMLNQGTFIHERSVTEPTVDLVNSYGISISDLLEGAPIDVEIVRSPELTGQVVDEHGEPIVGAAVTIFRENDQARVIRHSAQIGDVLRRTSTTTELDGRFRIRGFTPGVACVVVAESERSPPTVLRVGALSPDESRDIGTMSLRRERPWTLRLVRPSGHPLIGVNVAVRRTAEGSAIPQPVIIMLPSGTPNRSDQMPIAVGRTDARGEFVVRRAAGTRFVISLVDRPVGIHLPGGMKSLECNVDPSNVCVVVVEESPVIAGGVVATTGINFADLTVTAIPSTIPIDEIEKARKDGRDIGDPNGSASEQRDFRRALRGSARVQPDGSFEIELTASGEYTLEVTGRGVNFSREDRTLGGSLLSSVVDVYEVDRPFAVTGRENPPIKVKRIGPRIPATAIEMASEASVSRAREFFPQYFEK